MLPQPNQQLKTTFVGVVLLSVRKTTLSPHHHVITFKEFKATKVADFWFATLF
jgi:hypothetical protein